MSKEYLNKLKDPRWQKKRLEIFERDGWKCSDCGRSDKMLAVHHLFYSVDSPEPWEYPNTSLITLCEECHLNAKDNIFYITDSIKDAILMGVFTNEDAKTMVDMFVTDSVNKQKTYGI